jgi:hypothetical protein
MKLQLWNTATDVVAETDTNNKQAVKALVQWARREVYLGTSVSSIVILQGSDTLKRYIESKLQFTTRKGDVNNG